MKKVRKYNKNVRWLNEFYINIWLKNAFIAITFLHVNVVYINTLKSEECGLYGRLIGAIVMMFICNYYKDEHQIQIRYAE